MQLNEPLQTFISLFQILLPCYVENKLCKNTLKYNKYIDISHSEFTAKCSLGLKILYIVNWPI